MPSGGQTSSGHEAAHRDAEQRLEDARTDLTALPGASAPDRYGGRVDTLLHAMS